MTVIDELIAILGYKVEGEKELARFKAGVDGAQQKLSAFAGWARIAGAAAAAAAVAAAGASLALAKGVIQTSAEFEKYQATLETIEASSDKAKAALNWASDFAAKTPYELAEVTEAFVRLRAYGLDPLDGTMLAVGDATSAMGKSLMQGVEAIADAATGEFERLKEFGYVSKVAGDQVTFNWQQNGKQMSKTVKKTGKDISAFLKESFGSRFQGAMMRQSKTWNGMMSNLSDAWDRFKLKIGQAGFFDAARARLGRFLDRLGALDADGTLNRAAAAFSRYFTAILDIFDAVTGRLSTHVQAFLDLVNRVVGATIGFEGLKKAVEGVASAFLAPLLAIDEYLTWLEGGKTVLAEYIGTFEDLRSKLSAVVEVVKDGATFVAGFVVELAKIVDKAPVIGNSISTVSSAISTLAGWAKTAFENLQAFVGWVFPKDIIPGDAFKAGQEAAQAFINVLNTLIELPGRIVEAFRGLGQRIKDAIGSLPNVSMGMSTMPATPAVSPGAMLFDLSPASQNALDNLAKTQSGGSSAYRSDGRPANVTVNTTVNQTVTQPTAAPGAAASATAGAVNRAVSTPARQAAEPASSGW